MADLADDWATLWATARGRPVEELAAELRALQPVYYSRTNPDSALSQRLLAEHQLSTALTARVMSDPRWLRHHPVAALALAWRHRDVRRPDRTLRWLLRPRFAG